MLQKNNILNHDDIVKALDDILTHKIFASSPKAKAFLTYIVKETLEGRGDALTGTIIAQDVYGKGADFDPSQTSQIRVTARRVRNMLELYYSRKTTESEIKITIPKGGYRPDFERLTEVTSVNEIKNDGSPAPLAPESKQSKFENKSKKNWPWIKLSSMAGLAIFTLCLLLIKPDLFDSSVNEAANGVTAEPSLTESNQRATSYPMIAVTPFKNQTQLERFDFLQTVLQKKLVEDISRFELLSPVIYQGSTEAALAETKEPYNYVISSTILSVEPELDLLVKVIDSETSSAIYEQRIRRSVGTSDYFDSLSDIVSELSSQSRVSISSNKARLIEEQINQGTMDVSELETFECVRLSSLALAAQSSDRYKQAYTCLESLLEQDPENATLMSHFGVLTFLGARRSLYRARSFNPDITANTGLELMKRAVELEPENGMAHYFLSEACNIIGDKKDALKHAEIGHIANPASIVNMIALSSRLAGEGQWERALALADEVIDRSLEPRASFYRTPFAWALNNNDKNELQRVADKIDELGYYYSDIFLFLAAVANEDEKTIKKLRSQVIYFANEDFDNSPDDTFTIVEWTTLNGSEEINANTKNLFAKGGVELQMAELK